MSARPAKAPEDDFDLEVELLLEAIYRRWSYDFRHYSRASIRRRIAGALARLPVENVAMLQHGVLRDRGLFMELLSWLTVPVSDCFRDPDYFRALRQGVLPVLATYPTVKVWVAGCSTGEEAYSIAILLHEAGLLERSVIYATDICPASLRSAEAGAYALDRASAFTVNYQRSGGVASLADYYTAAYGRIVFDRRLRERITFSDHCLATDQVFSEVHLVSCRNVMIYFDRPLQERAVGLFRDSLVPLGFLGLGSRERLPGDSALWGFVEHARDERIYRRR